MSVTLKGLQAVPSEAFRLSVMEAFSPGSIVDGRYRIEQHIGDGAMAMVDDEDDIRERSPLRGKTSRTRARLLIATNG